ncbi:hypothetical protein D3C71_1327410 [compost metagenome]
MLFGVASEKGKNGDAGDFAQPGGEHKAPEGQACRCCICVDRRLRNDGQQTRRGHRSERAALDGGREGIQRRNRLQNLSSLLRKYRQNATVHNRRGGHCGEPAHSASQ